MNSNTILPSDDTTKAFCLTCAYPLNPLDRPKGQCPECGRSFDLGDPATFSPAPNHLRLRRLRQQMYCRLGLLYDAYRRAATKPTRWLWPAALVVYATAAVASMLLLGDLLWPIFYLCAGLCVIGLAFTPCRIVRRDLRALGKFPADAVITDRAVFRRIGNASVWLTTDSPPSFALLSLLSDQPPGTQQLRASHPTQPWRADGPPHRPRPRPPPAHRSRRRRI